MKKLILSMALLVAFGMSFTSCRETKEDPDVIIIKADEKTEKAAEEAEGKLEKAGKAVDNAAEKTKEAGQSIEDAVEEIGDDN